MARLSEPLRAWITHLHVSRSPDCGAPPRNRLYRQPVFGGYRVGRFMSDVCTKSLIDRYRNRGYTVAVADEIAVGRERHARRGDFQPAML